METLQQLTAVNLERKPMDTAREVGPQHKLSLKLKEIVTPRFT